VDERPTGIAKDPAAILELLQEACDLGWGVRVSYRNAKGVTSQLNVAVDDVWADSVLAEVLPSYNHRTLALQRVQWARVLTEAEEDQLL
jgi:fructose-specific phosphotransferase system component IIB